MAARRDDDANRVVDRGDTRSPAGSTTRCVNTDPEVGIRAFCTIAGAGRGASPSAYREPARLAARLPKRKLHVRRHPRAVTPDVAGPLRDEREELPRDSSSPCVSWTGIPPHIERQRILVRAGLASFGPMSALSSSGTRGGWRRRFACPKNCSSWPVLPVSGHLHQLGSGRSS